MSAFPVRGTAMPGRGTLRGGYLSQSERGREGRGASGGDVLAKMKGLSSLLKYPPRSVPQRPGAGGQHDIA